MQTSTAKKTCKRRVYLRRLAIWTLLWVATEALVVFGHKEIWDGTQWITFVLLGLNFLMGLGMVLTYRTLMNALDELERKIQLESMGLTLGFTLVVGVAYSVMDITNLIQADAEIGTLIFFMGICYIACILINTRRYA